jgi:hypothetical protein
MGIRCQCQCSRRPGRRCIRRESAQIAPRRHGRYGSTCPGSFYRRPFRHRRCLGQRRPDLAAATDGRYEGLSDGKRAGVASRRCSGPCARAGSWRVRGPSGLFMVEATVNAACTIVAGSQTTMTSARRCPWSGRLRRAVSAQRAGFVTYQMKRLQ